MKNQNRKDKETKELLETWDIVNCYACGKEISMLDAKLIRQDGREHFICKRGH